MTKIFNKKNRFKEKIYIIIYKFMKIIIDCRESKLIEACQSMTKDDKDIEIITKNLELGDIIIQNDVWVGAKSTIMSGVKIHNGAVIGGNSTVTKDVEPFAVYAGNPARFIKFRFTEKQIESLLKISWWDWPEEKIKNQAMRMWSDNIDEFIEKNI